MNDIKYIGFFYKKRCLCKVTLADVFAGEIKAAKELLGIEHKLRPELIRVEVIQWTNKIENL